MYDVHRPIFDEPTGGVGSAQVLELSVSRQVEESVPNGSEALNGRQAPADTMVGP